MLDIFSTHLTKKLYKFQNYFLCLRKMSQLTKYFLIIRPIRKRKSSWTLKVSKYPKFRTYLCKNQQIAFPSVRTYIFSPSIPEIEHRTSYHTKRGRHLTFSHSLPRSNHSGMPTFNTETSRDEWNLKGWLTVNELVLILLAEARKRRGKKNDGQALSSTADMGIKFNVSRAWGISFPH